MKQNFARILELIALFILLPSLFYFEFIPGPKAIPLLVVFVAALIYLLRSKSFSRKEFGLNGYNEWGKLAIRLLITGVILLGLTLLFTPNRLFVLPKTNPRLWVMIMVFYPIWSAFTQELIYRPFFFFRYKPLFKSKTLLAVTNGLLFGFLHIIFKNWIAVIGSSIIGIVWALTYTKHRSLLVVAIEHSVVGGMLYTLGLGYFFYVPDF